MRLRNRARNAVPLASSPSTSVQVSDDVTTVQAVEAIIVAALRERASDVHVAHFPTLDRPDAVRVRYRVDGVLRELPDPPPVPGTSVVGRLKAMAGLSLTASRPQEGRFSLELDGRAVAVRVSTVAVVGGERLVVHLPDPPGPPLPLARLGLAPAQLSRYAPVLGSGYGLVLCAGPAGAGLTTTLYASLGEVDAVGRSVMTVEDPVERILPAAGQVRVDEAAGITFAGALRSVLRQEPDVLMLAGLREPEPARLAVRAAAGRLVLVGLTAPDAVSALYRLPELGVERFHVASSVMAVLAQRLVRRVCPDCARAYRPAAGERALLAGRPATGLVHGAGCERCAGTGYHGRVGVFELLPVTGAVRECFAGGAPREEVAALARREGMCALADEAIRLAVDGVTTLAELRRAACV